MSSHSDAGGTHFFQGSSNIRINNAQLFAFNIHSSGAQGSTFDHLRSLEDQVATNAILNAGGRADEVRCYPGTRMEVISQIERWMAVGYHDDRRVFWLSGPAGAGKSAIVQTVAENCIIRGAPMANFFFFRADTSRNHLAPFVATLLHQLIEIFPDLITPVAEILSRNRLVLKKPLRDQFMLLIDGPVRALRRDMPDAPPIIFLVDGLDECDSRADLDSTTKSEQATLLSALHELVTGPDSLFIALVASRVESHLQMAFNRIGYAKISINLNQDHRPEDDIRLYICAELEAIRSTHPLSHRLGPEWPSEGVIDTIVDKSSGQFIYASTVARFIANSPESPVFTMEMVLNVRPHLNRSPFAEMDAIYTFILSRSKHWERTREIIVVDRMIQGLVGHALLPSSLGYSEDEAESFFSDLTSIIQAKISDGRISLKFYHASFNDFIYSSERAGRFLIDLTAMANSLSPRVILCISQKAGSFPSAAVVLRNTNQGGDDLTHALANIPPKPRYVQWTHPHGFEVLDDFFAPLKKLYAPHDPDMFRKIFDWMQQKDWIPNDLYLSDTLSLMSREPADGTTNIDHGCIPNISQAPDARDGTLLTIETPAETKYDLLQISQKDAGVHQLLESSVQHKSKRRNRLSTNWIRRFFC